MSIVSSFLPSGRDHKVGVIAMAVLGRFKTSGSLDFGY